MIPLPLRPMTVRELAELAAAVPKDQVVEAIGELWRELDTIEDNDLGLRHWIMLSALVNRAVFEVFEVPKDLAVVI
jgi:hypothetical protein